ncbi:unnamed protein product [Effrenium voratum]|uniref:Uncharacterized protein n=1 Tax=Effrenium voratum TaxID=2562239 RepID=A0AA36IIT3_9DINO|nr:unnamed protein product [Effrenium voratum]CAJ1437716.1 unnamed protein product [Effrenium voratum]
MAENAEVSTPPRAPSNGSKELMAALSPDGSTQPGSTLAAPLFHAPQVQGLQMIQLNPAGSNRRSSFPSTTYNFPSAKSAAAPTGGIARQIPCATSPLPACNSNLLAVPETNALSASPGHQQVAAITSPRCSTKPIFSPPQSTQALFSPSTSMNLASTGLYSQVTALTLSPMPSRSLFRSQAEVSSPSQLSSQLWTPWPSISADEGMQASPAFRAPRASPAPPAPLPEVGLQMPLPEPAGDLLMQAEFNMELPQAPGRLTAGLADPDTVERCRDQYAQKLDGQLSEATRKLEQANADRKAQLRREFHRKCQQYADEVDNLLLEQARVVVEEHHDRLIELQQEAERQRQRLEYESRDLLRESRRYHQFKAEARRLLGSMLPSSGIEGRSTLLRDQDPPSLLQSLQPIQLPCQPDLRELLAAMRPAPPPPPPPPRCMVPQGTSPLQSPAVPSPAIPSVALPTMALSPGVLSPAPRSLPSPSHDIPAFALSSPVSAQSGQASQCAPRLELVNRSIQTVASPACSAAACSGFERWTPPQTPQPHLPMSCSAGPRPMASQSPLVLQRPPSNGNRLPRGISEQLPPLLSHTSGDRLLDAQSPGNPTNAYPVEQLTTI